MNNQAVTIISFEKVRQITTKNNDVMLVGDVSNGSAMTKFVIFPGDYNKIRNLVNTNSLFLAIFITLSSST